MTRFALTIRLEAFDDGTWETVFDDTRDVQDVRGPDALDEATGMLGLLNEAIRAGKAYVDAQAAS